MASVALRNSSVSLSLLFARYVRGEIGDTIWANLMRLLDDGDVTTAERLALARFMNEVVAEGGPSALFVPVEAEARSLLGDTRPSNPFVGAR